jgi:thioredoxin 1
MKLLIQILFVLAITISCTKQVTEVTAANVTNSNEITEKRMEGKGKLLFFINPSGMPCQMQDQILNKIKDKINSKVDIVYYQTTAESDLQQFYKYGVRALPSIIVLNSSDMEFKRFPPGIQSPESIIETVEKL